MTKVLPLPPVEYLRTRLRLDVATGRLYWRPIAERRPHDITWNKRFAGKEAGADKGNGYLVLRLDGKLLLAHRVVAAMATGEDPFPLHIDHTHGARAINTPDGLRCATHAENNSNRTRLNTNNRSGVAGVYWHSAARKWAAAIGDGETKRHLGLFTDIAAAAAVRRAAEAEVFGAFAPAPVLDLI